MSLAELSPTQKEELVVSLSALVVSDSGGDMSPETLQAVIDASGNSVAPYWAPMFGTFLSKVEGGCDKFCGTPGSGGGGGGSGGGGGGGGDAPVEEKKEEKVEEEIDMGGAMDMFGGGGDGY